MSKDPKQPDPIFLPIPIRSDGAVMYSMMPIGDLMKIRNYIDDLIKWIAAGNPVHIGTYTAAITVKEDKK